MRGDPRQALRVQPGPLHNRVKCTTRRTMIDRRARPGRDHEVAGRANADASFHSRSTRTRPSSNSTSRTARAVFGSTLVTSAVRADAAHGAPARRDPRPTTRGRAPPRHAGPRTRAGQRAPDAHPRPLDQRPEIRSDELTVLLPTTRGRSFRRNAFTGFPVRNPSSSAHEQNSESAVSVPRTVQARDRHAATRGSGGARRAGRAGRHAPDRGAARSERSPAGTPRRCEDEARPRHQRASAPTPRRSSATWRARSAHPHADAPATSRVPPVPREGRAGGRDLHRLRPPSS